MNFHRRQMRKYTVYRYGKQYEMVGFHLPVVVFADSAAEAIEEVWGRHHTYHTLVETSKDKADFYVTDGSLDKFYERQIP